MLFALSLQFDFHSLGPSTARQSVDLDMGTLLSSLLTQPLQTQLGEVYVYSGVGGAWGFSIVDYALCVQLGLLACSQYTVWHNQDIVRHSDMNWDCAQLIYINIYVTRHWLTCHEPQDS